MAKLKNAVSKPVGDCSMKFVKSAGKEMVDAFDNHYVIFAGKRGNERFHFCDGAKLVVAPVHK